MFARVKKSGKHHYLQVVENRREGKKTVQRVVSTLGRMDQLTAKGEIEVLVRSLARFSEKALLVLWGKSEVNAEAKKIGPALIFDRLWKELGIDRVIRSLVSERKFEFNVERAIFLTVLHRLFPSGSDRFCDQWRREYVINGANDLCCTIFTGRWAFWGRRLKTRGIKLLCPSVHQRPGRRGDVSDSS